MKRGANPPMRPLVPISAAPPALHALMEECWEEHPELRPTFQKVREAVLKLMGKSGENIVDHLIKRMEQYAAELEHEAEEKMNQFMEEKQRSEAILNGMLPKYVTNIHPWAIITNVPYHIALDLLATLYGKVKWSTRKCSQAQLFRFVSKPL